MDHLSIYSSLSLGISVQINFCILQWCNFAFKAFYECWYSSIMRLSAVRMVNHIKLNQFICDIICLKSLFFDLSFSLILVKYCILGTVGVHLVR